MADFKDYKAGDRVVLVTYGGYPDFKAGMMGTVAYDYDGVGRCVLVKVDNSRHGPLNFFFREIRQAVETLPEFYLIRQRKDNPLKLKVMYANDSSKKMFTTRRDADAHEARMTRQHGTKFNFFVVKKETV